jgi:phosphinothricin acetyltransferase
VSTLVIRDAVAGDAPSIAQIYNHYIQTSTATFDEVPKTTADRVAWISAADEAHPRIVAERDGVVVGFASITPYRERPAWRLTAEVGVYVSEQSTGSGIGPALLDELVVRARRMGLHVLVSQVTADNAASLKMGERAGFEQVGMMREVGRKFDRWLDLVILEMLLEPSEDGTA